VARQDEGARIARKSYRKIKILKFKAKYVYKEREAKINLKLKTKDPS
jgi:hypothetical protein